MNSLTRRSVLGAMAAASLVPPALAQAPVTLKIAYPAWDTKAQEARSPASSPSTRSRTRTSRSSCSRCPSRCCGSASSSRRAPAIRPTSPMSTAAGCPRWRRRACSPTSPPRSPGSTAPTGSPSPGRARRSAAASSPCRTASTRGWSTTTPSCSRRPASPSFPKTMDELAEAAVKITGGGVYGWGLIGAKDASLISRYINFLYAFHGDLLDRRRQEVGVRPAGLGRRAPLLYRPARQAQGGAAVGDGERPQRRATSCS